MEPDPARIRTKKGRFIARLTAVPRLPTNARRRGLRWYGPSGSCVPFSCTPEGSPGRARYMFFLSIDEILAVLGGNRASLAYLAARRAAYQRYCALPSYPVLYPRAIPPISMGDYLRGAAICLNSRVQPSIYQGCNHRFPRGGRHCGRPGASNRHLRGGRSIAGRRDFGNHLDQCRVDPTVPVCGRCCDRCRRAIIARCHRCPRVGNSSCGWLRHCNDASKDWAIGSAWMAGRGLLRF